MRSQEANSQPVTSHVTMVKSLTLVYSFLIYQIRCSRAWLQVSAWIIDQIVLISSHPSSSALNSDVGTGLVAGLAEFKSRLYYFLA
jgi:hypothetical protein